MPMGPCVYGNMVYMFMSKRAGKGVGYGLCRSLKTVRKGAGAPRMFDPIMKWVALILFCLMKS